MDIILKEAKKVAITILVIDILIVLFTLAAKMFNATVIYGMLYGFIFTELNFILLGTVVDKALTMDKKSAKRHMQINYFIRFAFLAVILAIPILSAKINEWCVLASMFAPKFTYYLIGLEWLIPKKGRKD